MFCNFAHIILIHFNYIKEYAERTNSNFQCRE